MYFIQGDQDIVDVDVDDALLQYVKDLSQEADSGRAKTEDTVSELG